MDDKWRSATSRPVLDLDRMDIDAIKALPDTHPVKVMMARATEFPARRLVIETTPYRRND